MKGKRIAALLLAAVLVFSQEGISSLTVQAAQMPEEQSTAPQTEGTGTEDDKADQENRGEKEQRFFCHAICNRNPFNNVFPLPG